MGSKYVFINIELEPTLPKTEDIRQKKKYRNLTLLLNLSFFFEFLGADLNILK